MILLLLYSFNHPHFLFIFILLHLFSLSHSPLPPSPLPPLSLSLSSDQNISPYALYFCNLAAVVLYTQSTHCYCPITQVISFLRSASWYHSPHTKCPIYQTLYNYTSCSCLISIMNSDNKLCVLQSA